MLSQIIDNQNKLLLEKEQEIAELKAQNEKMKQLLEKWYKQHSDKTYTKTFYENLINETEKLLWSNGR